MGTSLEGLLWFWNEIVGQVNINYFIEVMNEKETYRNGKETYRNGTHGSDRGPVGSHIYLLNVVLVYL